ncbi:MAG: hypothetical protein PHU03_03025 [Syntrophales bacterium]|nr:hypothetical protein [Syntrophales bacterium]
MFPMTITPGVLLFLLAFGVILFAVVQTFSDWAKEQRQRESDLEISRLWQMKQPEKTDSQKTPVSP